jgi:hypothetical protein
MMFIVVLLTPTLALAHSSAENRASIPQQFQRVADTAS